MQVTLLAKGSSFSDHMLIPKTPEQLEEEQKVNKDDLLLKFQYAKPDKPDENPTEKYTIFSQTPGEIYLVERLIFKEVLTKATLEEFSKAKIKFPSDKELRKLCLSTQ